MPNVAHVLGERAIIILAASSLKAKRRFVSRDKDTLRKTITSSGPRHTVHAILLQRCSHAMSVRDRKAGASYAEQR